MTIASVDIPSSELFNVLKLTRKFSNPQQKFPLSLDQLSSEQLTALADAYAELLVNRADDTEPLGRKLVRFADVQTEVVVDEINEPSESGITPSDNTTFVKTTGSLLTGTGNPNGKLRVLTNSKLELALGIRKHNNLNLITPVNDTYTVELAEGEDWIIVFSAGLLAGTTNIITSLYDVKLTMFGDSTGLETGAKAVFTLEYTGKGYNWVGSGGLGTITDSATNADKSVSQNIQRLKFFSSVVHPTIPAGTVPKGTFKVRLEATHKKTGDVMANTVVAVVSDVVVPDAE